MKARKSIANHLYYTLTGKLPINENKLAETLTINQNEHETA